MAEWLWRVTQAQAYSTQVEQYSHGLCPRGFESPSCQHQQCLLFFSCFCFLFLSSLYYCCLLPRLKGLSLQLVSPLALTKGTHMP